MNIIFTIIFMCISVKTMFPQQFFCSTNEKSNDYLMGHIGNSSQQIHSLGKNYILRIFIHIIRKSDGSGGITMNDVNTAVNILKNDFEPHGICFSLMGTDEIWSDYYYYAQTPFGQVVWGSDCNNDGKFDVICPNSHSNAIDIYLTDNDGNINVGALNTGFVAKIPSTSLLLRGSSVTQGDNYGSLVTSHIISHEVGHCLGLYHTFHGCEGGNDPCGNPFNNCLELVNGVNCSICGDYVCDTPADVSVNIYPNINYNTCQWTGGGTCTNSNYDANGEFYSPDKHNIMSYSYLHCYQYFSPGQGNRMKQIISNYQPLLNCVLPQSIIIQNQNYNNTHTTYYDVEDSIQLVQSFVYPLSGLVLRAGQQIKATGPSRAYSGSFFHAYIDNNCSTIDSINSTRKKQNTMIIAIENEKFKEINITPNPANTSVKITLAEKNNNPIQKILLKDLTGKTLLQKESNTFSETIDISHLSDGLYFVIVQTIIGTYTEKLIVRHE